MTLKGIGAVVVALLACGRGRVEKSDAGEAPSPKPKAREEFAVKSLPLELGVGDDRERTLTVWPADGSPTLALPAGTRVERVADLGRTPPSGAPERGLWRVRVTGGPKTGLVAYARADEIQAAR